MTVAELIAAVDLLEANAGKGCLEMTEADALKTAVFSSLTMQGAPVPNRVPCRQAREALLATARGMARQ